MKKVFLVGEEPVKLADIAAEVEQHLKVMTVPLVVNAFRENGRLDLLESIMPMLPKGFQNAIDDVLQKRHLSIYG